MKRCPELEEWSDRIDRDARWRAKLEEARTDAHFTGGLSGRADVLTQVKHLLNAGILIHKDDTEGLREALGPNIPGPEQYAEKSRAESAETLLDELVQLLGYIGSDTPPTEEEAREIGRRIDAHLKRWKQ